MQIFLVVRPDPEGMHYSGFLGGSYTKIAVTTALKANTASLKGKGNC